VVLATTFVVLAVMNGAAYALAVGSLRQAIARPHTRRLLNRVGGSVLIGAGAMTAALRRV